MISFILGSIFIVWCLVNRYSEGGKVEGQPLGMPKGTVRALITVMLVAFPLGYIIRGEEIPPLIVNAIFLAVAFYFEARRSEHEKLKDIIDEIKTPELIQIDLRKEKKPLYLPKYSVRFLLVVLLVITLISNYLGPDIPFVAMNTILDLLIIISLFIIGTSFRSIINSKEKENLKEQIANMDSSLSEVQIIEKLMFEQTSQKKRIARSVISIIMLIAIITALIFYTVEIDYTILSLFDYDLTLNTVLVLSTYAYYGFRD